MRIELSRTFPATPAAVHAVLVDPDTQSAKAAALNTLEDDFAMQVLNNGLLEVVTRRRVATAGLPEFVRSLVKSSMTVIETERWQAPDDDGSREAAFLLDIEGAPVKLRGNAHLRAVDDGCQLTWCGVLEATVPFFRSKIAESASASVIETIEVEYRLIEQALTPPAKTAQEA